MRSAKEKIKSIPGKFILERELSLSSISNIYLGVLNDVQAVIRLDLSAASRLAIDRQHEVNILKDISHLDLAPKVLYSDISAGILIWEYIPEAQPPFAGKKFNSDTLYQLGSCLYSLHSHPIPKNSVDIFSNSMALYQSLLDGSSEKTVFNKALDLYKELLRDGANKVLSHNDLHQGNLLWNQKYYFLDWEYAGVNHPCFDIASMVKSLQLNQSQIDEMLIGYKFNNKLFYKEKLNLWIEFIDYLDEIWRIAVAKI
ncbi:phosphotransferase [Gammaproteobacteria bacterium]|nr:phosphotransferase [Gammaproteobacteria bacterium]